MISTISNVISWNMNLAFSLRIKLNEFSHNRKQIIGPDLPLSIKTNETDVSVI